jgi:diketogulonate reductase-like aldo/keto reductase
MCKTNGKIEKYFDDILKSLRLDYLDCLLVHWPFEKYLENTWKTFEKLYVQGKVRSIGLCNIDRDKFKSFASKVVITPQIVQNEISPAHSSRDDVEYFKANGVLVQAYSPLCRMLPFIKENKELQRLGEKYNKSIPQIILRWHYERGVAPVFTSSKPSRIVDNTDIFDFSLTSDEVELVTNQNIDYKIFLESFGCPEY